MQFTSVKVRGSSWPLHCSINSPCLPHSSSFTYAPGYYSWQTFNHLIYYQWCYWLKTHNRRHNSVSLPRFAKNKHTPRCTFCVLLILSIVCALAREHKSCFSYARRQAEHQTFPCWFVIDFLFERNMPRISLHASRLNRIFVTSFGSVREVQTAASVLFIDFRGWFH